MTFWKDIFMYYDVEDRLKWNRWFAWYPVKTTDNRWTWLRYVNKVEKVVKDVDGYAKIVTEYEKI